MILYKMPSGHLSIEYADKVAVVKYLKASGVRNARVIVGLFLENFVKM